MTRRSVTSYAKIAIIVAALALTNAAAHAFDSTPSNAPTGLKAAQQKIAAGDYRGAIPILTPYVKDHPDDADGLNLMGFSLRKTGQTDLALQYYNRALALQPKHLGANEYLGELYVELGQMDKAKERLAVLQAACGNCEESRDLSDAIQKGVPNSKRSSW